MFQHSVSIQDSRSGRTSQIISTLLGITASYDYDRLRVAVAYATIGGCKELIRELQEAGIDVDSLHKEWLVSVDFGTTQPDALRFLRDITNSAIRIPNGLQTLASNLKPKHCFHPKTFWFQGGDQASTTALGLMTGSANLTFSGLHHGTEHASSSIWIPPFDANEQSHLDATLGTLEWWSGCWAMADVADEAFVTQYEQLRPAGTTTEDDEEVAPQFTDSEERVIEPRAGVGWALARCFWIQTYKLAENLGAGKPGNQVDCRRGTRVFFGFSARDVPQNTVLGDIPVRYVGKGLVHPTIRFGDNSMDKLNLPVPGEAGPPSYDHKWLHFTKREGYFELEVSDGENVDEWRSKSEAQGMNYTFGGGSQREYGFYS